MDALRSLGVRISHDKNNDWNVDGVGVGGFTAPENIIDC